MNPSLAFQLFQCHIFHSIDLKISKLCTSLLCGTGISFMSVPFVVFCLVLFAFATNSSHKHAMLYTVHFIHTNKMAVKTITFRFQLVYRKGFRIHLKMENNFCVLHAIAFKNIHLIFERFIRMKQPCKMVKMIFPFCAFVLLCAHILYPHFSYWFVCLRARAHV